jgi:hypothetical protein
MIWPFVIAGYAAPLLIASFALGPAGELIRRWGRTVGCAC